jgi:hypothetical protein
VCSKMYFWYILCSLFGLRRIFWAGAVWIVTAVLGGLHHALD